MLLDRLKNSSFEASFQFSVALYKPKQTAKLYKKEQFFSATASDLWLQSDAPPGVKGLKAKLCVWATDWEIDYTLSCW